MLAFLAPSIRPRHGPFVKSKPLGGLPGIRQSMFSGAARSTTSQTSSPSTNPVGRWSAKTPRAPSTTLQRPTERQSRGLHRDLTRRGASRDYKLPRTGEPNGVRHVGYSGTKF